MRLTECGLATAPGYPKESLSLVLQPCQYQKSDLFHPPKHNTQSINKSTNQSTNQSIPCINVFISNSLSRAVAR